MTVAKKSILNIICGMLGQFAVIAAGIVVPRLVLVSFGSEVNGLLNSATQIFVYFNLFEAGISVACLQALYEPVANHKTNQINGIMSATNIFYKKTGIIYALAVIVLALIFPFLVDTELPYHFIFLVILFGGLGNSLNFLFQGKYKILMQVEGFSYITANITTIINIAISLVKIMMLIMGFGVIEVQISGFIINIIQMLIYYIYVKKRYSWIDLGCEPDKDSLSQKNATFVHQISQMIFNNTDTLLLTIITRDLKIVSIYSMYNLVTSNIMVVLTQLPTGVDFRLGQLYNTKKESYYPLHHVFEIVYLVVGFSVMSVVYIMLIPFIRLYTNGIGDAEYINKLYPLFFVLGPMVVFGRYASSNVINYAGHFKNTQWRAVIEAVLNITVSVFGIWKYGIFGALFGTIAAAVYRTIDMIIYDYKYLIKGNILSTVKRWAGCFFVFALLVLFVNNDNPRYNSYLIIFLYAILIGIAVLLLFSVVQIILNPRQVKDLINILKGVIHKDKKD